MRQSISNFKQTVRQFENVTRSVENSWRDDVKERFYEAYVAPMKQEASEMAPAMEELANELYRLKEEIDRI
ncbi:MAG: hypothetical protein J5711_01750 [Bacteroidales bacterium]|nr:hypothetical protein [Bacteroidales bacterium]